MKIKTCLFCALLAMALSSPSVCPAASYVQNVPLSWPLDQGTYFTQVSVPDSGTVTRVSLKIDQCDLPVGDLGNIAMQLIAPDGTSIYLFDATSSKIIGPSLLYTHFNDDAAEVITEGQSPYTGSYRPVQSLEGLEGVEMNGTWTLAVTEVNRGNDGTLDTWTLYINEPETPTTPTPLPTPTPGECLSVEGDPFAWERGGMWYNRVYLAPRGLIEDVTVEVSLLCGNDLSETGLFLFSPQGGQVALYKIYNLLGKGLEDTVFDDSAVIPIENGSQPFVGSYRPVEPLNTLRGEWMAGTWTLGVFSANDEAGGSVSSWTINCCYHVPPTPTPSTTGTPSPVPSATPSRTPVGYKTPRPTRTPSPAPTPSPLPYCVNYQGVPLDVYPQDVEISSKYISDPRKIASVIVTIQELTTEDETGLDDVGIYLYSPWGGPVALFELNSLAGSSIYGTIFDDDAGNSITEGQSPYPGRWHPVGNLSDFNGQTIAGTWKLLLANGEDQCETGNCQAHLISWGMEICAAPSPTPADMPTPLPTPGTCQEYSGPGFTIEGADVSDGKVSVQLEGKVRDIELSLEGNCSNDLSELTAYLISPSNTTITLFEMESLSGNALYQTVLSDTASTLIKDGSPPYIGIYRPVQAFSNFAGENTDGYWTLAIYNSREVSTGQIENWKLNICWIPPSPTPTPKPSPTPEAVSPDWLNLQSGDYDGDATSDVAYFRPSLQFWSIRGVGTDFFGSGNDVAVSGDYDGDGTSEIAVFRPDQGLWLVRWVTRFYFGNSNDIILPRDYTGDGTCQAGLFRPQEKLWKIRHLTRFYFGQSDDQPLPGDWNGDGTIRPAFRRTSNGLWKIRGLSKFYFGLSGDLPFPAEYDGAETLPAIFRPQEKLWIIRDLSRFYFGQNGDNPVPADYKGDGTICPAVFRSGEGLWIIRQWTRWYWGKDGDIPVSR